jgi:hypothetical protein
VVTQAEFDGMQCDSIIRQVLTNMAHRLHSIDESYERFALDETKRHEFMSTLSARRDWAAL